MPRRPQSAAAIRLWRVTLFISNLTSEDGAEAQFIDLARVLNSRGWNISVLSPRSFETGLEPLISAGIRVHSLDAAGRDVARPLWNLSRYLNEAQPHILHCQMSEAVFAARLTRAFRRIPVVISTLDGRNSNDGRTGWRMRGTLRSLTNWMSDATTTTTCTAAANQYLSRGANSRRPRVIPNGIVTDRFHFRPETRIRMRTDLNVNGEFVWLMSGGFHPHQDHHTLVRSFARVVAEAPRTVLLLGGDGPLKNEIEDLSRGLGIGSRVRLAGVRWSTASLLTAADACVLSTTHADLPVSLLQAAAAGLPCVATDVGGIPEVAMHGVTGFLVPPSNPEALSNAMLRLSQMAPATRARMGERARAHVAAHFAMDEVAARWEQLYSELLAEKEVTL